MKITITRVFLLISLFYCQFGQAQTWVWMHSTDTLNVPAINGTLNVSSPSIRPGSLSGSANWTDAAGNFWLFGGNGYLNSSQGPTNDLWKFTVSTNSWTRVRGNGTSNAATYGTLSVTNSNNNPGGRANAATWADNSGNLWMFGGYGVIASTTQGYLNDLWKYNISADQWTWMGGSSTLNQLGLYGSTGVPSTTNIPGARSESCHWIVGTYLYLYGGSGCSANTLVGYLGDLWRFNTLTGEWVFLKGSNTSYLAANHGTQGFSSVASTPGCRSSAMCWKDNSNNIWMGGGLGFYSGFGTCTWADLWQYNATTNIWTWIKGSNVPFVNPAYGSLGVGSSTTDPGARTGCATWTDTNGDFWLFGGDSYLQSNLGDNSDLWKYSLTSNQWIWMKGPSSYFQSGTYGTMFLPALANNPPYRKYASAWKDSNGNFWMHGGASINPSVTPTNLDYADMWKLNNCSTIPSPPTSIATTTNAACGGSSLSFTVGSSAPYVFWLDASTGTVLGTGTVFTNTFSTGVYTITALNVNNCNVSTSNPVATLTLFANPTVSVSGGNLCLGRTFTMNPSGCVTYSYSSGSNTVAPSASTSYSVVGYNAQGCVSANTAVCNVTIIPSPTVSVNNGSLCAGLTFSMFPTGATNYSFSSGSSISMNVQASSIFTVIGAYPNGCRDTAYANLTVYQLPVVSLQGGTICAGQSISLVPSGAATYTFSSGTANVSPAISTIYTVSGTSSVGCVAALPGVAGVTVFSNPNIGIAAESATVCNGEVRTFTATGGAFYTWNIGETTQQVVISFALSTLTLNVAGIDANGCANTASLIIYARDCTGIEKVSAEKNVEVYPNPFTSEFNVRANAAGHIKVYDVAGKIIMEAELVPGLNSIDLKEQAAGIYFAIMNVNGVQQNVRLIKQ